MQNPVQLDPPLELNTPLGHGWAYLYYADGYWTVFLDTGAVVIFPNEKVRACNHYTMGRWNPGQGKKLTEQDYDGDADMRRYTASEPISS